MRKNRIREEYDHETGEVVDVEDTLVSLEEVSAQLAELRSQDKDKVFEWPDPRPMSPPLGYIPETSLSEKIRQMVRSEHLRYAAMNSGMETFEEADDFDVDDDFDPSSPYEMFFDQPIVSAEAHPSGTSQPLQDFPAGGGGAQPPSGEPSGGATAPPSGGPGGPSGPGKTS